MGFRNNIVVRVIIILLCGYSAIYLYLETPFWLLSIWIVLITMIVTISLVRYTERNRRDMTNFLLSIQQNDFTTTFPSKENSWQSAFNAINEKFKELRSQKQSNYHFLEAVVEHTGVPLICYDTESDKITLMNEAAKMLFQKPFIDSLKALRKIDKNLPKLLEKLHSGYKELYTLVVNNESIPLSILAKELKIEDKNLKLVAFQNIKHELEEKELESWQKLIKVLTHEIKNSAIPISTLSAVIAQMIVNEDGELKDLKSLNIDDIEDLKNGLITVEKRSKGLVNFVESYSQLSKLPEPNKQSIIVKDLFNSIENLMKAELDLNSVNFTVLAPKDLVISVDRELIEQVLINLIKNASQACKEKALPKLELNAHKFGDQTIISVKDNGIGISSEELENIFIPFFTTKSEGSGIGLSLSRQIMRAHNGSISVKSDLGKGSEFYLKF